MCCFCYSIQILSVEQNVAVKEITHVFPKNLLSLAIKPLFWPYNCSVLQADHLKDLVRVLHSLAVIFLSLCNFMYRPGHVLRSQLALPKPDHNTQRRGSLSTVQT